MTISLHCPPWTTPVGPSPFAPSTRRRWLLPLLLVVHGGLAYWFGHLQARRELEPPRLALSRMRLLAERPRPAPAQPASLAAAPKAWPQPAMPAAIAPPDIVIDAASPAATPSGSTEAASPAAAGNGHAERAPLIIKLPPPGKPGQFSPGYNPAAHDPRANSIRLTFEEKMAIATGNAECFLEELNPDGSIFRGPGRLVQQATAIVQTGAAGSAGSRTGLCVRRR